MATTPHAGNSAIPRPGGGSGKSISALERPTATNAVPDTTPSHTAMPSTTTPKTTSQPKVPRPGSGSFIPPPDSMPGQPRVKPDQDKQQSTSTTQTTSTTIPKGQPATDGAKRLSEYVAEFYRQDNPVNRLAAQYGYESAAARGLNNSSVAIGTAQENVLRRADTMGTTAFQQDNVMTRHRDNLESTNAYREAQIDKMMAEIEQSTVTGADGTQLSTGDTKAWRSGLLSIRGRYSNQRASIMANTGMTGDDRLNALSDLSHAEDGEIAAWNASYGISIDSLRYTRTYDTPGGLDWNADATELVAGWAKEGLSPQGISRAAQYGVDTGFITTQKQQQIEDALAMAMSDETFFEGRDSFLNPSTPAGSTSDPTDQSQRGDGTNPLDPDVAAQHQASRDRANSFRDRRDGTGYEDDDGYGFG